MAAASTTSSSAASIAIASTSDSDRPRDAAAMDQLLRSMGVTRYEPKVINMMLEFMHRHVRDVLLSADDYKMHAGRSNIDMDDIELARQQRAAVSFTSPPPREVLMVLARQKNRIPLPLMPNRAGVLLPPDKYCLTQPIYHVASERESADSSLLPPATAVSANRSTTTTAAAAGNTSSGLGLASGYQSGYSSGTAAGTTSGIGDASGLGAMDTHADEED